MGVGGASPTAGTSCATCLRKFTVHFRRPYNFQKRTKEYKGEFGFDWLRDEYIFPVFEINRKMQPALINKNYISGLKKVYIDGTRKITPWGIEYIPSHLAIFATKVKDKNASSKINVDGALLSIELHQVVGDDEVPLQDDGTKIIFETNEKCIKISTSTGNEKSNRLELPISFFIKNRKKTDLVDQSRWSYSTKNAIRISCEGATTKGALISVKAIKGNNIFEVGQMSVFANDKVPIAKICFVDVSFNQNKVQRPTGTGLEYSLKYESFNQALIRPKIVRDTIFNIKDMLDKNKTWDLEGFYNKYYVNQTKNSLGNSIISNTLDDEFKHDLIFLFQKYAKVNGLINSDSNDVTYVFFTNTQCSYTKNGQIFNRKGSAIFAPEAGSNRKKVWGNSVVIYHHGATELETVVHEIVHSFGLSHVFQNEKDIPYCFHKGFTDNFMDYEDTDEDPPKKSLYKGNQIALFRHQWLLMRNDRSLDYNG